MHSPLRATAALTALLAVVGCAPVDGSEAVVESRSNCHTSTGEFVAAPSCTISYSRTVSQTTTTTTTTTTEAAPDTVPPPTAADDDQ